VVARGISQLAQVSDIPVISECSRRRRSISQGAQRGQSRPQRVEAAEAALEMIAVLKGIKEGSSKTWQQRRFLISKKDL